MCSIRIRSRKLIIIEKELSTSAKEINRAGQRNPDRRPHAHGNTMIEPGQPIKYLFTFISNRKSIFAENSKWDIMRLQKEHTSTWTIAIYKYPLVQAFFEIFFWKINFLEEPVFDFFISSKTPIIPLYIDSFTYIIFLSSFWNIFP